MRTYDPKDYVTDASQLTQQELSYFIYVRKSTEGDERQAQSIPDQLKIAKRKAAEMGLKVVDTFTESKSARKPGRPIFMEMLERIRKGEANGILAWHPDRLARNAADGGQIIELLDSGQLRTLEFANFWFENTSQGKMNLGLAFVQSKYYTDNLSENVFRGLQSKADRGIYPNGSKRGYLTHPKTKSPVPDPETFRHVRTAYELYSTGRYSLRSLSEKLHKLGFRNLSGGLLAKRQIVDLLTDPFYYGAFVWNRELYEGIHDPAVSKELWDKVQLVYIDKSKPQSKWKHQFPFCGLMHCAECGSSITAEQQTKRQKNGNVHEYVYYRCTKKNHRQEKCKQPFVRDVKLVEQLHSMLGRISLPDEMAISMLEQLDKWESEVANTSSTELDLELEKITAKLCRLNDLFVDGELDRADYAARKRKLIEKIALSERVSAMQSNGHLAWLEPLREFLNTVWERNLHAVGADLNELRNHVAEVGSNLKLNSRILLWDWNLPYALLAERGQSSDWWRERGLWGEHDTRLSGLGFQLFPWISSARNHS